jgi:hypothetical protein
LGTGVAVGVAVLVGVRVFVSVGVLVGVRVAVGVGVRVGPNNWPGPQALIDTNRTMHGTMAKYFMLFLLGVKVTVSLSVCSSFGRQTASNIIIR